jgi:hypothetical protein
MQPSARPSPDRASATLPVRRATAPCGPSIRWGSPGTCTTTAAVLERSLFQTFFVFFRTGHFRSGAHQVQRLALRFLGPFVEHVAQFVIAATAHLRTRRTRADPLAGSVSRLKVQRKKLLEIVLAG